MLRAVRLVGLGVALATALLAAVPVGVGAVDIADYIMWRSTTKPIQGIGTIWEDTDVAQLRAEYIDLAANRSYRLVLSSAPCNHVHQSSDLVRSRRFDSNANGAAFLKVEFQDVVITSIRSARVFRGSTQVDCGRALRYMHSGSAGTDLPMENLTISSFNQPGIHFIAVIARFSGQETFTYAAHGLVPSDEYVLRATNAPCPDQPAAIKLQNTVITSLKGTAFEHENVSAADGRIRSIQVFHGGGNDRVACAKAITLVNPN